MICRQIGLVAALSALFCPMTARGAAPAPKLALSRYLYGYQADSRKPVVPSIPASGTKGESVFAVRPYTGTGPWFSCAHTMWHRDNLTSMRHTGIDVALPVFRGDEASLSGYAEQGLDAMAQALIELKKEHEDYPLIGMFYDTDSLGTASTPLNVGTDAGKAAFYGNIRRYFVRIPEEFRALIPSPGGLACILALGSPASLSAVDASLKTYVDKQFEADFGRKLLWLADSRWKSLIPGLDAYTSFNDGKALVQNLDGRISVSTIGPGYNDSASISPSPAIRRREAGSTMIDDWRNLFSKSTDWIIVETWNDFARGSAIAGSREYGVRDQDQTMAGIWQFHGSSGLVTQALRVNAPAVMPPKAVVPIEVVVQNGSLEQWGRGNITFAASWYQGGKLIESGPRVPVMQFVPGMGILTVPTAAVTARADGTPLPDGDYELRVEFFKTSTDPANPEAIPFNEPAALIPVKIGKPVSGSARLVTSDAMPWMMSGTAASHQLVVRNDSPVAWPANSTTVMWRLMKEGSDTPVASGQSAPLKQEIGPGSLTPSVLLEVTPPRTEETAAKYSLMWDVSNGQTKFPVLESPSTPARRMVTAVPLLELAHFPLGNSAPATWEAGTEQDIRAVVRNVGPGIWKSSEVKVGCHWYYWDGTEALWDGQKAPLPNDVKPGGEVLVHCPVMAPQYAGAYTLVMDVWDGKQWISTLPGSAGFDMSIAYVIVTGGSLRPVDLTGLFDIDGVASEISPADGDFDGGFAYPGDQFPPDVQAPLKSSSASKGPFPSGVAPVLYPAGYFGPVDTVGTRSIRRIPFRYPVRKDGERNFILARGQTLPVGQGAYNALHVLGSSTVDSTGDFKLNYTDGTSDTVSLQFSGWTDGPKHGEPVGLQCTYRRSVKEDDPSTHAYLYVYTLTPDAAKSLVSITFPEGRKLRVCAITADHKAAAVIPGIVKP